jgi:membrane associated rhomboid family serine protease
MFPLRDENPSSTTPIVTRSLIVINLLVFVYELSLGPGLKGLFEQFALTPSHFMLAVDGAEPWWRAALPLLTSMFLHGGWVHVIGNMWFLWIFGDNIEDRFGHLGYLVFYLLAGIVAGLIHVASNPASAVPTVGASGAIAGVLGAYAAAFPRARVITLLPLFPFFQVIPLPAILVLGFWFVIQFASGALALAGASTGGVAVWAHVGGFVFGVVVMLGALAVRGLTGRDAREA